MCSGRSPITVTTRLPAEFHTYNGTNGMLLRSGVLSTLSDNSLVPALVGENSIRFITHKTVEGGRKVVIEELRPTSNSPPTTLEFTLPLHDGDFSFSPPCHHASFVSERKVTILDIRDSRVLFQVEAPGPIYVSPGHFSPDGSFFAYKTLQQKIHVWKRTPTGYTPWTSLILRSAVGGFTFSPTASSILSWGTEGIQVWRLDHRVDFPPPEPRDSTLRDHGFLVACSAGGTYVASVRWQESTAVVLDLDSGATLQSIVTGIEVFDIKMASDTIFAVGIHELLSWRIEGGRIADVASVVRRKTFSDSDLAHVGPMQLSVSFNGYYHRILLIDGNVCFLRRGDIITQTTMQQTIVRNPTFFPEGLFVCHIWEGRCQQKKPLQPHILSTPRPGPSAKGRNHAIVPLTRPWTLGSFLRPSSGYRIVCGEKTHWVADRKGRKLLWLPLHWRSSAPTWSSNCLAFLDGGFPEPVIIRLPDNLS